MQDLDERLPHFGIPPPRVILIATTSSTRIRWLLRDENSRTGIELRDRDVWPDFYTVDCEAPLHCSRLVTTNHSRESVPYSRFFAAVGSIDVEESHAVQHSFQENAIGLAMAENERPNQ